MILRHRSLAHHRSVAVLGESTVIWPGRSAIIGLRHVVEELDVFRGVELTLRQFQFPALAPAEAMTPPCR